MNKNSELIAAVAVIVVLAGLVISNTIRHLKWEERRFMWHVRMAVHCMMFVAIVAGAGYIYLQH